jgi:hypothetical protein
MHAHHQRLLLYYFAVAKKTKIGHLLLTYSTVGSRTPKQFSREGEVPAAARFVLYLRSFTVYLASPQPATPLLLVTWSIVSFGSPKPRGQWSVWCTRETLRNSNFPKQNI